MCPSTDTAYLGMHLQVVSRGGGGAESAKDSFLAKEESLPTSTSPWLSTSPLLSAYFDSSALVPIGIAPLRFVPFLPTSSL